MKIKGYTLVECMIAALIFVLIMLFGFGFFFYGQEDIEDIKITDYALRLAKDAIEHLQSINYNDIISTATVTQVFQGYNITFTRTYGVVTEIYSNEEQYKIVYSSVSYVIDNTSRTISLQTIISPF